MLKQETNDLLTPTGPETPMNALFRQCWIKAASTIRTVPPAAYPARS